MPGLKDLSLDTDYHKGRDNIADEFYLPCMAHSVWYDRAVGFFNSTIYTLAWSGLKDFVDRDGRMRIICSPVLSPEDIEAMGDGYRLSEEENGSQLRDEVRKMLSDPSRGKPTKVLATLIALGVVDVKIAFMPPLRAGRDRLFHDKLGLFSDEYGNVVAFKGSMNETWAGLSDDGNLESIDVFVSWEERDRGRIQKHVQKFEQLWKNDYPSVTVRSFPDIARAELVSAAEPDRWRSLVDEICEETAVAERVSADQRPGGRTPRPHQVAALAGWEERGRKGIFEHATGSGKTFTALCAMRDSLARNEAILVLVPSELLLKQWDREVAGTLQDSSPNVLLCGAGHTSWKESGQLASWTRRRSSPLSRIVIATMQTAASQDFLSGVRGGEHLFVVADEVHRVGSPHHQRILSVDSGPRLGLSATPRRAGDPNGTKAICDYFGDVVPPPFTLQDAIRAGALTPYFYRVHPVQLSCDEQESWDKLTNKINQLYARNADNPQEGGEERIKNLQIQRARIIKNAAGKVPLARDVLQTSYRVGDRWIIYCDSQTQLNLVLDSLRDLGMMPFEYHSAMEGDRRQTLSQFEANGGIMVSIKCLDEGVDIPSVDHALILASSKNPREFIQRRGRILRTAEESGKTIAFLHDAIVVPRVDDPQALGASILTGEFGRAIEFGRGALNPSAVEDLSLLALRAGLDYKQLFGEGFESDEDGDE